MAASALARAALATAACFWTAGATLGAAVAQGRMEMGVLECKIAPGTGATAGSAKTLTCSFTDAIGIDAEGGHVPNRVDFYGGSLGLTADALPVQVITWDVYAPDGAHYGPGALAGPYTPESSAADASLIGGLRGMYALQEVSPAGRAGAAAAHEVTALSLVAR